MSAEQKQPTVWSGIYDAANLADPELKLEFYDLQRIGASPIGITKMNNGVDFLVNQLEAISKMERELQFALFKQDLLRTEVRVPTLDLIFGTASTNRSSKNAQHD